jgi:FtsP/CotA-like multicopper oxidase with cupredoxin domain
MYLNEHVDGTTLMPLGMQINGVPFEYKVTETPKKGTIEVWKIINLTVDAHPMHPHLVKHQMVERQRFNVGAYKRALCGSTTCQPGTAPGPEMQVVPDITATLPGAPLTNTFLTGLPIPVLSTDANGGWKDASMAMPGEVTTIIARWDGGWATAGATGGAAPGTAGGITDLASCGGVTAIAGAGAGCAAPWNYESVTSGPYVWHCHINSHEDSEMMRTSLVVP